MKATVTNMSFNNGLIYIEGKTNFILDEESCSICIRRREMEHGIEYPEEYCFSLKSDEGMFSFKEDIKLLFNGVSLKTDMIWDFFLFCNEEYVRLEATNQLDFKDSLYHPLCENLFKAKPYITGDKKVSIYILKNDVKAFVKEVSFNEGILNASIYLEQLNEIKLDEKTVRLTFKKREQEGLFEYYESKVIEVESTQNPIEFSVDIDQLFEDYELHQRMIWDTFIEIQNSKGVGIEVPLLCSQNDKMKFEFKYHNFTHNDLFRVKPYVVGMDNIAIFIRKKEVNVKASEFDFENNIIYIKGKIDSKEYMVLDFDTDNSYIVLKKRYTANGELVYFEEKAQMLNILNSCFEINLNVPELLKDQKIRHKDIWDVFVRLTTFDGRTVDVELSPEKQIEIYKCTYEMMRENREWNFKPYVNGNKSFSIYFVESGKLSEDAIEIAVLGSCFSRNAFNSRDYFNPGYKKHYNCSLTQFHSSIISLMSNSVSIDMKKFEDVTDKNKEFIRCDFEKDFFAKLKEAKPDYLIIDLYADAARDLIKVNDESYISASMVLRGSQYFKELMDYEFIGHSNNQLYFEIWKTYMEKFAEKVKEILPEDRIILNIGGFTYKYVDIDGTVKKFPRSEIIKRNNYFWELLNGWFMQSIPNCKVINLKDTNYIGQHNHPFGNTFSHYQPGYYKEFMSRLNKLVMQDLQKKSMVHW
ncbi:hypothetical protein KOY_01831 [Bacillus cereus VDM021]|uniref:DUF6270 domain-containing protein n=2 Tax=Bacteria TaxID=2 RepID=UPI00032E9FE0|nr:MULTISPECIES: DUF6270 domain-containing protein [Bacillus cereus group]EOQ19531.1 hypothetical protein KOY_01831 [Bacillus cereus VDM021]MDF2083417.1 DUF6270 domain-containing protein [Bacillus pseudomycoides]